MNKLSENPFSDYQKRGEAERHYHCPICKDRGVVFHDEIAYLCECKKDDRMLAEKKKAGITPHLLKQSFSSFDLSLYDDEKRGGNKLTYRENASRIKKIAMEFVDDVVMGKKVSGLFFNGPVGSGKTFLAAACANALVEKGVDVRFLVVPDFLDQLRETFQNDSPVSEGYLMDEIKKTDVLVLDDLGAHNYTDWTVKTIFAIINYRLNYEKPMIVTSNLSQEEIEKNLSSRIFSRLAEACRFFKIENSDIRIDLRKTGKGRG